MASVIVVGAGIVGAAVARALAHEGHAVTVVERGASAGGTSASGEGNILVSDKALGPELDLALRSTELWRALEAELRAELPRDAPSIEFEPKGGVVVATTDDGARSLLAFAARQRTAGVVARELGPDEAHAAEPHLTDAVVAAVHYPGDAQVQPAIATEALLASARLAGARVLARAEVLAAAPGDGRIAGVVTSRGTLRADHVVVAAGPWSAAVAERLGSSLAVLPRRGVVLVTTRMPRTVRHKVYDADYVGAVESGAAGLQFSGVVESTASGTVLIGSSREQRGFDARLPTEVLRGLARRALALFPCLADAAVMRAYGGFRPYAPDHLPVIGEDARVPGLWFATGHEGAGIGLSLGTAELVADLLAGRPPSLDPAAFSPARAGLRTAERAA